MRQKLQLAPGASSRNDLVKHYFAENTPVDSSYVSGLVR